VKSFSKIWSSVVLSKPVYCWPALRARYAMVVVVIPSSAVRCPSRGHISETKQNRPIVTVEHFQEVGIGDSVAAFRSSQTLPWRDIQVSTLSPVTWRHTTTVVNRARPSSRRRCCKRSATFGTFSRCDTVDFVWLTYSDEKVIITFCLFV